MVNNILSTPFWAHVRLISQQVGYVDKDSIKIPSYPEMVKSLQSLGLASWQLVQTIPTEFGELLHEYFLYRSSVLTDQVRLNLMTMEQARVEFDILRERFSPRCPLPLNKQKNEKRAPAYFTGIVNMLIEANLDGLPCNYDPHKLIVVTKDGIPIQTFARRVDGAFPGIMNPLVMWEVKEYYYTTTFGSRVADGIYETLLDGLELKELREHSNVNIAHLLFVDAYSTWWEQGRSYLCRIIDMLNMGLVDEVMFGREVLSKLPELVQGWVQLHKRSF